MEKSRKQQLQAFLNEDPSDSFTRYLLALECLKYNELQEACSLLRQVLKADSTYLAAYYQLGKLLEILSDKEEAKIVYQQGIIEAGNKKDMHTFKELKLAYNTLCGIFDEDEW